MSSSKLAISVENVVKAYTLGHKQSRFTTLGEAMAARMRNPFARAKLETFQALKGVSFDVNQGEVVGIIGRNGAGKSTLLKILSRITRPTTGRINLYGRVGSLLEVGTGFHPELTGRENIYLNGAILGMRRREIDTKFEEIVAFADVEKFLDTPVKRYSSGMYVRLAFAVAAHLNPEILIIDEVLAVGDLQFQKKCLGKMGEVASQQGRTVLFVSHNMTAIQSLCSRVVWLDSGRVMDDGPTKAVVSRYSHTSFAAQTERVWTDPATAPGNDVIRIRRVSARRADGVEGAITVRTPVILEFEYWNFEPDLHLNLSLHIFNEDGIRLFNTAPIKEPHWHGKPFPAGLYRSICHIPGDMLNDGSHRVQLLAVRNQHSIIFNYEDALVFEVNDSHDLRGAWHGNWEGAVRPILDWETEQISDELAAKPMLAADRQVQVALA